MCYTDICRQFNAIIKLARVRYHAIVNFSAMSLTECYMQCPIVIGVLSHWSVTGPAKESLPESLEVHDFG